MKTVLEAETAQKKVDTGKDFDHAHIRSRIARDDPPSDKNLKTGNLNEVNVAKSIGEKRNESVKLWFMKYLKRDDDVITYEKLVWVILWVPKQYKYISTCGFRSRLLPKNSPEWLELLPG